MVHSHCGIFFLIATVIPLIAANGWYSIDWKCSHYATVTTSPPPMQLIVSKTRSQSQIVQCERALMSHLYLVYFEHRFLPSAYVVRREVIFLNTYICKLSKSDLRTM